MLVADIIEVPRESVQDNVDSFISYLFNEGYISFVSKNMFPVRERNKGGGINLLEKSNKKIAISEQNGKQVNITF